MKFDLLKTIRNLFRGNKMSYDFNNVKVLQIEEKINLKETATNDGKNNLPRSSAETFSNCESEAIITADEFRNNQVSKAVDYLNSIKGKVIDSTAKLGQKNFYVDEFKNRIEQTLTAAEGKLSNLKSAYTTQNNEVRNFKLENKLNREPKSLTTFNIMIAMAVIAVLFYIELQVNANLLAPAMASGLKEGMAIAAAVAGFPGQRCAGREGPGSGGGVGSGSLLRTRILQSLLSRWNPFRIPIRSEGGRSQSCMVPETSTALFARERCNRL